MNTVLFLTKENLQSQAKKFYKIIKTVLGWPLLLFFPGVLQYFKIGKKKKKRTA